MFDPGQPAERYDRSGRAASARRALAGLAIAALLPLAAGCGDDGAESSGEALTRAEFVERGDAICQRLYEQRDPLEIEAGRAAQQGDSERAAQVFENAAEITQNRVAELRELPVPEGDEEVVEEILDRGEQTAETAVEAAEAIRAEDSDALSEQALDGRRITTRFNKAAIDYGFFACGRGVQAEIG